MRNRIVKLCKNETCGCRTPHYREMADVEDWDNGSHYVWRCANCGKETRIQKRTPKPGLCKSQEEAIAYFRRHIEENLSKVGGECIKKFDVKLTEHGRAWISCQTEFADAKGTLLDALSSQWWSIEVGRHGRLTAMMYPDSVEQFRGSTYLGVHIK